jgi:hypothetical protein
MKVRVIYLTPAPSPQVASGEIRQRWYKWDNPAPATSLDAILARIPGKNGTDVRTFVSVLVRSQLRVKSGKLKDEGCGQMSVADWRVYRER